MKYVHVPSVFLDPRRNLSRTGNLDRLFVPVAMFVKICFSVNCTQNPPAEPAISQPGSPLG